MTDISQLRSFAAPPPPPPLPRTGLTVDQQLRLGAAHVAAVALSGHDGYSPGDVAVLDVVDAIAEVAARLEPQIRDGFTPPAAAPAEAPAGSGWDPLSPQWAVIRAAIKFRLDPSDENREVLFAAVDELPHIGETREAPDA